MGTRTKLIYLFLGFITRNGEPNDVNKKFIELAKAQWLNRLAKTLPTRVLDKRWPPCPYACRDASKHLHVIYRLHLARKYRLTLDPKLKQQFELKVLAESLFKGFFSCNNIIFNCC